MNHTPTQEMDGHTGTTPTVILSNNETDDSPMGRTYLGFDVGNDRPSWSLVLESLF